MRTFPAPRRPSGWSNAPPADGLPGRTSEALATSARQLAAVMGAAVATTAAIMVDDAQPGAVRLAAARTILSDRARLVDEIDILARLEELEKMLDEQGH